MRRITVRLLTGICFLCSTVPVALAGGVSERSGNVNAQGLMTLANQTQLFIEPDLALYYSPQFQWGLGHDLELLAILGAKFGSEVETDAGLLALRYELVDGLAVGLGGTFPLQNDKKLVGIYPGLYYTQTFTEGLTWTANVALNATVSNIDKSWLWHTSVVEYVIQDDWSVYAEIDWIIPIDEELSQSDLNLYVGGQYNLNTAHALNLFVMMPLLPSVAPENLSVGLTWALAWSI